MANKSRKPWAFPPAEPFTRPRSFQSLPTLPTDSSKASAVPSPKACPSPPVSPTLKDLQALLEATSLPLLPEPIAQQDLLSCLYSTLLKLLKQQDSQKELTAKMKELAHKYQQLMASSDALNLRLAKYKAKCEGKYRQMIADEEDLEEIEVFRSYFGREFRAESEIDGKIMDLIGRYGDKIRKLEREIEYFRENSAISTEETAEKSLQIATKEQRRSNLHEDYQRLEDKLGTNGAKETLEAVERMQEAINSLPKVEEFVRKVCLSVFPDLETSPFSTQLSNIDSIIPKITGWRSRLHSLSQFHHSLAHALHLSPSLHHLDILLPALLSDIEAVTKFTQLFPVKRRTEVPDQLEQVFILLNQAEAFLKDAAFALKIENYEAEVVYSAVLQAICARQRRG